MANVTKPIALDETLQRVAGAMENMALGKGVDTIIAEPYDATATYAVGDYVIHDGALYVCAVAIATAEAWTAAHWTEILLADEVKRALSGGGVSDVQIDGASVVDGGGVAEIPIATHTNVNYGVVKLSSTKGLAIDATNGELRINPASSAVIKSGGSEYAPLCAYRIREGVFFGLAKAAGDATQSASSNVVGAYTESAKSAIHTMLNGSVAVSGNTPTITGQDGIRYVCGEVSTISITPPASGIIDVVFESGTTPAVLTVNGTVRWANGFDPTSLDANTSYELRIVDGKFGLATAYGASGQSNDGWILADTAQLANGADIQLLPAGTIYKKYKVVCKKSNGLKTSGAKVKIKPEVQGSINPFSLEISPSTFTFCWQAEIVSKTARSVAIAANFMAENNGAVATNLFTSPFPRDAELTGAVTLTVPDDTFKDEDIGKPIYVYVMK